MRGEGLVKVRGEGERVRGRGERARAEGSLPHKERRVNYEDINSPFYDHRHIGRRRRRL